MVRCSTARSASLGAAHPRPGSTSSAEIAWRCAGTSSACAPAIRPRGRSTMISDQRQAEDQHAELGEVADESPEAADHHDRGQRDAELGAHAAEHDDREDSRRFDEGEALRADEGLARGEEGAGEAAEHRADARRRSAWCWSVLMPSERQAISSSRSASQARPSGRRRRRSVTQLVSSARPRMT